MKIKSFWRIVAALVITVFVFADPTLGQKKPLESQIRPFIGTWTAVHGGTPIIVLHLRSENLAVRFPLLDPLGLDLRGIADPQLEIKFCEQPLEPAGKSGVLQP